jgi:hypothetical protein
MKNEKNKKHSQVFVPDFHRKSMYPDCKTISFTFKNFPRFLSTQNQQYLSLFKVYYYLLLTKQYPILIFNHLITTQVC